MLDAKRDELSKTLMQDLSVEQVHIMLFFGNIFTDISVLTQNCVNGKVLSQLTSEGDVQGFTEISESGQCTRVIRLVRHMASGDGLPVPTDIYCDGVDNLPHTWSVQQLAAHLARNPVLKDSHDVFIKHKLAGDIINDMAESEMAILMKLSAPQRVTFKHEVGILRKTIQKSLSDCLSDLLYLCSQ
jgi:hypothetical protein